MQCCYCSRCCNCCCHRHYHCRPEAGVANHGPMLGWAIAKGHKISWNVDISNYMPSEEGTPQEGIGSGDEGTGSMGTVQQQKPFTAVQGHGQIMPQDGIGSGKEGTGSMGMGATAEAMHSSAGQRTYHTAHAQRSVFSKCGVSLRRGCIHALRMHGVLRSVSRGVLLPRTCIHTSSLRTTASLS